MTFTCLVSCAPSALFVNSFSLVTHWEYVTSLRSVSSLIGGSRISLHYCRSVMFSASKLCIWACRSSHRYGGLARNSGLQKLLYMREDYALWSTKTLLQNITSRFIIRRHQRESLYTCLGFSLELCQKICEFGDTCQITGMDNRLQKDVHIVISP